MKYSQEQRPKQKKEGSYAKKIKMFTENFISGMFGTEIIEVLYF